MRVLERHGHAALDASDAGRADLQSLVGITGALLRRAFRLLVEDELPLLLGRVAARPMIVQRVLRSLNRLPAARRVIPIALILAVIRHLHLHLLVATVPRCCILEGHVAGRRVSGLLHEAAVVARPGAEVLLLVGPEEALLVPDVGLLADAARRGLRADSLRVSARMIIFQLLLRFRHDFIKADHAARVANRLHHEGGLVADSAMCLVHCFRFHVVFAANIMMMIFSAATDEWRHIHFLATFLLERLQVSLNRVKQEVLLLDICPAARIIIHPANYSINIIKSV